MYDFPKSWSEIDVNIQALPAYNGDELMRSDLASLLISHKVFDEPSRKIQINYPGNIIQAESLAKYIKVCELCGVPVVSYTTPQEIASGIQGVGP